MIPKQVFYGWFGKGKKSELTSHCLDSWKNFLPDYKIIELNESNFPIPECDFAITSYKLGIWAYLWDYARMYMMYHHGGITLDTDVEILKPLDCFLKHSAFTGYEMPPLIGTAVMGTEQGHWFGKEMLNFYHTHTFNETANRSTNIHIMTELFQNNRRDLVLYPKHVFCPLSFSSPKDKSLYDLSESYAIHWFMGSWLKRNK